MYPMDKLNYFIDTLQANSCHVAMVNIIPQECQNERNVV